LASLKKGRAGDLKISKRAGGRLMRADEVEEEEENSRFLLEMKQLLRSLLFLQSRSSALL
jgi:hypothetical protein